MAADINVIIPDTADDDFATIQIIYAEEVLHGLATFEEQPPAIDELLRRHADIAQQGLPYLTAELDGHVVG